MSKSDKTYWAVFVRANDDYDKIIESKKDFLQKYFIFEDGYPNMISFPIDSKKAFVKNAKVNDFVLQINHRGNTILVPPFRRIIHIEENNQKRIFFLEARKKERSKLFSFNN